MISFNQIFLIIKCEIPKGKTKGISFTGKSTFSLTRDIENKSGEITIYLMMEADNYEGGSYDMKIKSQITYVDKPLASIQDLIFIFNQSVLVARNIISYEIEKVTEQYFKTHNLFEEDQMRENLEIRYNSLYHS